MIEVLSLEAADGRRLETRVAGPPDGRVVLVHHGTPGVGVPAPDELEAFAERDLRYVAFARAGYAGSTRRPGRSVADVTVDARAVLDGLGIDRCLTLGASGGGPHALACAARLPDRIDAATTIASVAPSDVDDLDFLAGMGLENLNEFGAAYDGPDALAAFLDRIADDLSRVTGLEVADMLGGLIPPVDRAALTGAFAESVAEDIRNSMSSGTWGWHDDDLAFIRPWGFALSDIAVPVDIWQGEQDKMVPFAHGEWLTANVARAQPHLLAEHGHLSLSAAHIGPILDAMLESAGSR